jgi:uncharacterized delta-60 repeat protein
MQRSAGLGESIGTATRRGVCLAVLLVAALPALAVAKPGTLDASFGDGGRVARASGLGGQPWNQVATESAALPDGRIVVLAGSKLYAFKPNGSIASSFGGGVVRVAAPDGYRVTVSGLSVDALGRVVVAGAAVSSQATRPEDASEYAMVSRYTPQGELDQAFGAGGTLLTDLGLPPRRIREGDPAPMPQVRSAGVAVGANDSIVLTGTRVSQIGPCRASSNLVYNEAFVARLDASGKPDPAFGQAGVVQLGRIAAVDPPLVDRDGGIYVATPAPAEGPCSEPNVYRFVGHLDSDGSADAGFGQSGWLRLPAKQAIPASTLAFDRSGRLLLFGESRVRRFLPTGEPDAGFGRAGIAAIRALGGALLIGDGAVDRAGGILVTGARILVTGAPGGRAGGAPRQAFLLARLTAQGRVDRRFGRGGLVTTGFGAKANAESSSLLIDGQGRAVVAGTLKSPLLATGVGVALARYRLGG